MGRIVRNSYSKLQTYLKTGHYKGFYPSNVRKYNSVLGSRWLFSFSNGKKKLVAVGLFRRQALEKMFQTIDRFYTKARKRHFEYMLGLEMQNRRK